MFRKDMCNKNWKQRKNWNWKKENKIQIEDDLITYIRNIKQKIEEAIDLIVAEKKKLMK